MREPGPDSHISATTQLMPTRQFTHYYTGGQERLKRDGKQVNTHSWSGIHPVSAGKICIFFKKTDLNSLVVTPAYYGFITVAHSVPSYKAVRGGSGAGANARCPRLVHP